MQAIEQLLITNAQEKSMASVLQDVTCTKCLGVSIAAYLYWLRVPISLVVTFTR